MTLEIVKQFNNNEHSINVIVRKKGRLYSVNHYDSFRGKSPNKFRYVLANIFDVTAAKINIFGGGYMMVDREHQVMEFKDMSLEGVLHEFDLMSDEEVQEMRELNSF